MIEDIKDELDSSSDEDFGNFLNKNSIKLPSKKAKPELIL